MMTNDVLVTDIDGTTRRVPGHVYHRYQTIGTTGIIMAGLAATGLLARLPFPFGDPAITLTAALGILLGAIMIILKSPAPEISDGLTGAGICICGASIIQNTGPRLIEILQHPWGFGGLIATLILGAGLQVWMRTHDPSRPRGWTQIDAIKARKADPGPRPTHRHDQNWTRGTQ